MRDEWNQGTGFPAIARAIEELSRAEPNRFYSTHEIVPILLSNRGTSLALIEAAHRDKGAKQTIQAYAGNMVQFFGAEWTKKNKKWASLFKRFKRERRPSDGFWQYRLKNERPARAFTYYGKNSSWAEMQPGDQRLRHAGSTAFRKGGVAPGDRVFIVTVIEGVLYLGGVIHVDRVLDLAQAQAECGADLWDAPEHIIAREPQPFYPSLRVPVDLVESLQFAGNKGAVFTAPAVLDQQTFRGIRELSHESADMLEEFLKDAAPTPEGGDRPAPVPGALGRLFGEDMLLELAILQRSDLAETSKQTLIQARRGQGLFRERLIQWEPFCRVTGVRDVSHLRASHIKPWKDSNDQEKLDGNNGLLLAPHVDHLFDSGFISFTDFGDLLVAPGCPASVLVAWGIPDSLNVGPFRLAQRQYLAFHRRLHGFDG